MILGSAASVLQVSSSLAENLNKEPFLSRLAQYTVNSPALSDPNSAAWEYRMIYTCVVDKNAFGAAGFGDVVIADQHNSPPKNGVNSFVPIPCNSCVTNRAMVIAQSGNGAVTNFASAGVCTSTDINIAALQLIGADVQVSFPSMKGKSYRVERAESLLPNAVWTPLPGTVVGTGGTALYLDVNGASRLQRYYRVRPAQ
jgi:hypothetical protein